MSRRSRPQYRSGLGWILGVAFEDTLTRPVRLAQGFTCVRCCGTPRASSPHDLTAPALASHDGRDCVQLPLARGCYHLAPRRTFTSNPVPMPGTPSATASGGFGLDKRLASDILRRQGFDGQERASSGPPTRLPGPDTTQIFLLTKKTSYKGWGEGLGKYDAPHPPLRATFSRKSGRRVPGHDALFRQIIMYHQAPLPG
jgi:hypothetical protein